MRTRPAREPARAGIESLVLRFDPTSVGAGQPAAADTPPQSGSDRGRKLACGVIRTYRICDFDTPQETAIVLGAPLTDSVDS